MHVLQQYAREGVAGVLPVDGEPEVELRISPSERTFSLLVPAGPGRRPDLAAFENVGHEAEDRAGVMWDRLDVHYDDNLAEVYPVLCAVADRIQLTGETFTESVEAVLDGLGDILAGRGGLSPDQQVGLFGELLVVYALAEAGTAADALTAWRGPDAEEHDFALQEHDVEVKTTLAERRLHWIGSLTQLVPSPPRKLFLLSLQITGSGTGPGSTLTELVDRVRGLPGMSTADLNDALRAAGWRDRHAGLYSSRWTLRTLPAFYLVDTAFPAITPERLADSVPEAHCIADVRYRLDVSSRIPAPALFPVSPPGGSST